jgi:hypothetical protein
MNAMDGKGSGNGQANAARGSEHQRSFSGNIHLVSPPCAHYILRILSVCTP